jgi:hypothetical protein
LSIELATLQPPLETPELQCLAHARQLRPGSRLALLSLSPDPTEFALAPIRLASLLPALQQGGDALTGSLGAFATGGAAGWFAGCHKKKEGKNPPL